MAREPRRQINLPANVYGALEALRDELTRKLGDTLTVDRGRRPRPAMPHRRAHTRRVAESPTEAAPILEERHRQGIVSALAQFAAATGRPATAIRFYPDAQRIEVDLADADEPVSVIVGPPITEHGAHDRASLNEPEATRSSDPRAVRRPRPTLESRRADTLVPARPTPR